MIKNNKRLLFKAMYWIIHNYYLETKLDDVGGLSGDMMIANDEDATADPAIWGDWEDAIRKVKGSDIVPENLTVEEGYQAAVHFFNFEADLRSSEDLKKFIKALTFEKWLEAVKAVDMNEHKN